MSGEAILTEVPMPPIFADMRRRQECWHHSLMPIMDSDHFRYTYLCRSCKARIGLEYFDDFKKVRKVIVG